MDQLTQGGQDLLNGLQWGRGLLVPAEIHDHPGDVS